MPGQGVGNVANVGASLESRDVRTRYGIVKDRLVRAADDVRQAGAFVALTRASGSVKPILVTATAAGFPVRLPARALRRPSSPACSPEK
jgi:hypothetical protein